MTLTKFYEDHMEYLVLHSLTFGGFLGILIYAISMKFGVVYPAMIITLGILLIAHISLLIFWWLPQVFY